MMAYFAIIPIAIIAWAVVAGCIEQWHDWRSPTRGRGGR
jgi:hypothetical protein